MPDFYPYRVYHRNINSFTISPLGKMFGFSLSSVEIFDKFFEQIFRLDQTHMLTWHLVSSLCSSFSVCGFLQVDKIMRGDYGEKLKRVIYT